MRLWEAFAEEMGKEAKAGPGRAARRLARFGPSWSAAGQSKPPGVTQGSSPATPPDPKPAPVPQAPPVETTKPAVIKPTSEAQEPAAETAKPSVAAPAASKRSFMAGLGSQVQKGVGAGVKGAMENLPGVLAQRAAAKKAAEEQRQRGGMLT